MRKALNTIGYLVWLVLSTVFLLGVIVLVDMYFAYKELHQPAVSVEQNNNLNQGNKENLNEHNSGLHLPHTTLGWVVNNNVRTRQKLAGNFDVVYTTDENGFRSTPVRSKAENIIYIFGDSFTFGHGVEDSETFASVISSVWLGEKYRVVNAGVNGYGLTQMYGRFLNIQAEIKAGDIVLFTPISKDLLRSYKDFAVPGHYLFSDDTIKFYPYFDNGMIKVARLDTFGNRIKALLFHAPLTGNVSRKIHRAILRDIDYKDAGEMFSLINNEVSKRKATFHLYFLPQIKDLVRGRYKYDVSRYEYLDIWNYFPPGPLAQEQIGFPDDGHWNCRGHEIAAYAIVDTLVKSAVIDIKSLQRSIDDLPVPCALEFEG